MSNLDDVEPDTLRLLIDSANDRAIFILNPEGEVIACTRGAAGITGWDVDLEKSWPLDRLYTQKDIRNGKPQQDLARAAQEGVFREEGWRTRRNGSEFLADITTSALRGEDGQLRGYGQVIYDITARSASETALRRSALHLESILATIPDGMVVIDERGTMLSFSSAAERLFGYTEAEMVGRNVSVLMPGGDRKRHDGYLSRYLETGEKQVIGSGRVVTGRRKDGSEFPVELAVAETSSEGHRIFTGFIRDLTEKRAAEVRLNELQSELIQVSRLSAMGTMASTLAHELNQPLTAIANYLQAGSDLIAQTHRVDPATVGMAMDEARREALRAGAIVRRLREFVARGEVEKRVEHLLHLIDEASRLALVDAHERGIHWSIVCDHQADTVLVDAIQIQQVLVNLIRNAIEAMEASPVRNLRIETAQERDGLIRVSVMDSGPGISPVIAPNLFRAFATSKETGMGLGLSICRTIVEAHGGRIWAEPMAEGGTAFHFTLIAAEEGSE